MSADEVEEALVEAVVASDQNAVGALVDTHGVGFTDDAGNGWLHILCGSDDVDPGRKATDNTVLFLSIMIREHGLEVTARNSAGQTPLHVLAARRGDDREVYAIAQLLIDLGSDVCAMDARGDSPFFALTNSHASSSEVARALTESPRFDVQQTDARDYGMVAAAEAAGLLEAASYVRAVAVRRAFRM